MLMGANTRAYKAGALLAESIVEMVNLMYQNTTALNFLRALCEGVTAELDRRKKRDTTHYHR